MPGDELSGITLNGHYTSLPPQSPIAVVGSRSFSRFVLVIFVVAVLDFGEIPKRDNVSPIALLGLNNSNSRHFVSRRCIQIIMKTGKELLETFHLFQYLSNSGKHRMRVIKRMSSSDQVS
jgi:hypothetical protein